MLGTVGMVGTVGLFPGHHPYAEPGHSPYVRRGSDPFTRTGHKLL